MAEQAAPPQEELLGFGDNRVEKSSFDRYKGRKGQVDRLAIISSAMPRAFAHYVNLGANNGKTFRCLSKPGDPAICCQKLGAPTQKFGLVVFQYTLDEKGDLVDTEKCKGTVKLWLISETRYEELSNIAKDWPLLDFDPATKTGGPAVPQHDLIIRCTEEQYQKMTFTPQKGAHWKTKQKWYEAIKVRENVAREKVRNALGKAMNETEVMELLGMNTGKPTGSTDNANDIDLGDVLD